MLHYILQILIFQLLFLGLYDVFHKKDTFFNWNRLYLLVTPVLSLVLPFIKINAFKTSSSEVYVTQLERVITSSSENLVTLVSAGSEHNSINWWSLLYFAGVGISILLLAFRLHKLKVLINFSFTSSFQNKKIIVLTNSNQAFSFWNTIYMGDQLKDHEKEQILTHELVHVEQKHSLDQLWFELLKIIFWWNPLMYIYQSRITVLHEYIADEAAVITLDKKNYIEQLLNAAFQTQEITFVNQFFNQSLIKKRILMLQKSKSKSIVKFKYLLLVPVIIGILMYTSCSEDINQSSDSKTGSKEINQTSNDNSGVFVSNEPKCPNTNSIYDKNLDNYLKVRSGKQVEVLIDMISIETSEKIRTAHLGINQTFFIRNVPEGKYKLNIAYGDDYSERTIDGKCVGYFKNEKATEEGNQILDFTVVHTDKGKNVPSYNLKVSLDDPSEESNTKNTDTKTKNTAETKDAKPNCPNKNSVYDYKLNNYLRLTSGTDAEVIARMVTLENTKTIRTIYIKREQTYFVRNIPEGKYKLHLAYGDDYAERTVNGVCEAYFKNEKKTEIDKNILDFNVVITDQGMNVPSYNMTVTLDKKSE